MQGKPLHKSRKGSARAKVLLCRGLGHTDVSRCDAVKQTAQSEHAAHALQLSFGHDEYQKIRTERSEDPELQVELPTHQHMCLACDTNTRDRMSWAKHFDLRLSRS